MTYNHGLRRGWLTPPVKAVPVDRIDKGALYKMLIQLGQTETQSKHILVSQAVMKLLAISLLVSAAVIYHPFAVTASESAIQALSDTSRKTLPSGLHVEESLLHGRPAGDVTKPFFVPVRGSVEDILRHHAEEREVGVNPSSKMNIDNELFEADFVIQGKAHHEVEVVQLTRKGKVIFSEAVGDASAVEPIRGLWAYEKHWMLEVARCKNSERNEDKGIAVYTACSGDIIRDGKSLNKLRNYQEAFSFQLMNGKPFYFFKKGGQIGISYGGEETMLDYEEIPHYYCCESSMLNPKSCLNMVALFARRDSNWYYVEVGLFR